MKNQSKNIDQNENRSKNQNKNKSQSKNKSQNQKQSQNPNKNIENLTKLEDSYRLKVGSMYVDMEYSKNNKSFNECMLNILKLKMK